MANLNLMELQSLRHLIGAASNCNTKLTDYANNAVDPQIKQIFSQAAQDSLNAKQSLMSFLEN